MTRMFTVEHIGLAAKDPSALRVWYERVLGAELVWEIAKEKHAPATPRRSFAFGELNAAINQQVLRMLE